jgi:hypothetical protein
VSAELAACAADARRELIPTGVAKPVRLYRFIEPAKVAPGST